jgi:REP element-mobilizing transposase RayT
MTRPLRIEYPGALYHVMARGIAGEALFQDDQDRGLFLSKISEACERYNFVVHAYCLMGNHFHLVAETPDGNLSRVVRQIKGVYGQYYNRKRRRVGPVFQGRFRAQVVEKERYLLEVCRYVVLNPVRARLVERPGDWAWSSYAATAGLRKAPEFLKTDWLLCMLERKGRRKAQAAYRAFIRRGMEAKGEEGLNLKKALLGGREFLDGLVGALKDKEQLEDIRKSERFAARPDLGDIFKAGESKLKRNNKIREAVIRHGYTLKEVAQHLGLHASTLSKVLGKMP